MAVIAAPQIEKGQLISDDEIESALTEWLQEIFKVAQIRIKPRVILLSDSDVNAGATFGGEIIVYTGLLIKCEKVEQLLGVLAHETGHIAGAHLATQDAAAKQALVPAVISAALGGAAALASGNAAPLAAGTLGGAQVFERAMLRYSQDKEESADSAALKYLELLGWPAEGLFEFLGMLNAQYTGKIDPYTSTHPLTPDRMTKVKLYKSAGKQVNRIMPALYEQRFQRIRAKIKAFMQEPQKTMREYPLKDNSIAARYARAIAHYRLGKTQEALQMVDELLKEMPNDPYFLELKGQINFETGKIKEAVDCYRSAVKQRPQAPNLNLLFAHALIESSSQSASPALKEAIEALLKVVEKEPQHLFAWRLLARAYGKNGQLDHAAGSLAEAAWLEGDMAMAKAQAKKAEKSSNPTIAKRAKDILAQEKLKS